LNKATHTKHNPSTHRPKKKFNAIYAVENKLSALPQNVGKSKKKKKKTNYVNKAIAILNRNFIVNLDVPCKRFQ
jgi:hypothetical protein